jgi:DNA gyrase subunit B
MTAEVERKKVETQRARRLSCSRMYIGPTDDGTGLHNMICEVVHNAINEALSGHATRVDVLLNASGSATVRDNGRGISVDIDEQTGRFVAELILTELHTVHQTPMRAPRVPDALVGTGLCVVNALSDWLELRIWREGKQHFMRFRRGILEAPLVAIRGTLGEHGTEITLLPGVDIFTTIEFDGPKLKSRLDELARLKDGLEIVFNDLRSIAR